MWCEKSPLDFGMPTSLSLALDDFSTFSSHSGPTTAIHRIRLRHVKKQKEESISHCFVG